MALVFAVMHSYTYFFFLIASVRSFFLHFKKKKMVLINRQNGPRYQSVLALCAFLTGAILKGQIFEKNLFEVCVCFVVCKFVSGLILRFLGKLWFDDLCEE